MRFLPTLEVRNQFIQVAFPDVHAVALAESCLLADKQARHQSLQRLLLDSPMLLFWVYQKWNLLHETTGPIPINDSSFESQLVEILEDEGRTIVRDHGKPLSSVWRIDCEFFVDSFAFFAIRQNENHHYSVRLLERLAIVTYLDQQLAQQNDNTLASSLVDSVAKNFWAKIQTDFDGEPIVKLYSETDFQGFAERDQISAKWNFELPVFRNGFDELDQRLDRLQQLEQQFDLEVEKAKVGAVQQLAYGASHEVNNPLANISTRAQALLRDETDPKRRQRLMTIDAQAFRAHDMISNLMTFAKPRRPEFERIQLQPIVDKSIDSLRSMAQENEIALDNQVEHSVYFDADKAHVIEIIFSLVQNAIEAIRSNGNISIRSSHTGDSSPVLIEVMDSGPGMSPEVRRHIFDPFFSGREAGRGLGFGMPKVWRLMELHNGTVRIAQKNGNTCIELLFPYQQASQSSGDNSMENRREKTA